MKRNSLMLLVVCFFLSGCVSSVDSAPINPVAPAPAIAPQSNCGQEMKKLERLLGELENDQGPEYSYNKMRLGFLLGNSYSRLAVCTGSKESQEYAIEAYNFAESCYEQGDDISQHQDAGFLLQKIRENREKTSQIRTRESI